MTLKKISFLLLLLGIHKNFVFCQNIKDQNKNINFSSFVNPFMGSNSTNKTISHVAYPFGSILVGLKYPSLEYKSNSLEDSNLILGIQNIIGESKYNLLTNFVFQPLDAHNVYEQSNYDHIYFRTFNLNANPGYLQVNLNNEINVQLTCSEQTAFHKYDYMKIDNNQLVINFDPYRTGLIYTTLIKSNASTIQGFSYLATSPDFKIYFCIGFSKNILNQEVINTDKNLNNNVIIDNNLIVKFIFKAIASLEVKTVYSLYSMEDAQHKLENSPQNFPLTLKNTKLAWENELQKIKINTSNNDLKSLFYSCFYRSLMKPNLSIANSSNNKVVHIEGHDTFSKYGSIAPSELFLNKFSFLELLYPDKAENMALSLFEDIQIYGPQNPDLFLQSIPIFSDLITKNMAGNIKDSLINFILNPPFLLPKDFQLYRKYGYIPANNENNQTITKSLFYNYIDWCTAQIALAKNDKETYLFYLKKSLQYGKLFDQNSKFFKPKTNLGNFTESFNVNDTNSHAYKLGNAWSNNFFVLHDLNGYTSLYQSRINLYNKLDSLFTFYNIKKDSSHKIAKAKLPRFKDSSSKIVSNSLFTLKTKFSETYKLGQFDLKNNYDWHTFYLFTIISNMDKTAFYLKKVVDSLLNSTMNNVSIFNDQEQLNTWLIWTCLGLYPLNPSDGNYIFGYPFIDQAFITLPNKRQLKIDVSRLNTNSDNSKILNVYFNGEKLRFNFINYKDLQKGGVLKFEVN